MIGLDANVVLRLLLNDDPAQNSRIDTLLDEHGQAATSVLISDVVLAEVCWTLVTVYQQDKAALKLAVRSLLDEPAIAFEDREAVDSALAAFESTRCGFVDCLIAAKNARLGAAFTATFDKRMSKLPQVRVI